MSKVKITLDPFNKTQLFFTAGNPISHKEMQERELNKIKLLIEAAKQGDSSAAYELLFQIQGYFLLKTIAESLDISVYALKRLLNHKVNSDITTGYIVMDIERLRKPMQMITNYIFQTIGDVT